MGNCPFSFYEERLSSVFTALKSGTGVDQLISEAAKPIGRLMYMGNMPKW